jgi:hypothetical protein
VFYSFAIFGFAEKLYLDQVKKPRGALLLLYDIAQWKISKANAKKHREMIRKIVEVIKKNREKLYPTHSTFCVLKSEDPSVETWMGIDEYKDQESYDKFMKQFQKSNPDWAEFFKIKDKWMSFFVPKSLNHKVFVEKPELRIA